MQGGPLMHTIASKAVCFAEALQPAFRAYATQVVRNAQVLATALTARGFRLVSGGTDNHLMLVDLAPRNMTGRDAAAALDQAGIVLNKNVIPFDRKSPFVTSGIRIGTPAVTTRGMAEPEMERIGAWIADVLEHREDSAFVARVRDEVREFSQRFPVP
jgi:glycine hydroxymethyltransferase